MLTIILKAIVKLNPIFLFEKSGFFTYVNSDI